ncbi:MAG: DUF1292 domain-containing protein [Clostridia bacterium]|nr:DUF1292 domain-containing protein [Clostridia bacterium]
MEFNDQEVDIVVFEDEEGNEVEFEIQFTFEHKGEEYAVMTEATDEEFDEETVPDMFILRVVNAGQEDEEFVAVDEDMMDELTEVVEEIFAEEFEEEEE